MSAVKIIPARAVADPAEGQLLACVEIEVEAERVFRALTSEEITAWWVRPGVFDTREWSGDVRVGGRWRAAGAPYKLIHTWEGAGKPEMSSTVTYLLEQSESGTRLTIRPTGFVSRDVCHAFAIGWEASLNRLAEILVP